MRIVATWYSISFAFVCLSFPFPFHSYAMIIDMNMCVCICLHWITCEGIRNASLFLNVHGNFASFRWTNLIIIISWLERKFRAAIFILVTSTHTHTHTKHIAHRWDFLPPNSFYLKFNFRFFALFSNYFPFEKFFHLCAHIVCAWNHFSKPVV